MCQWSFEKKYGNEIQFEVQEGPVAKSSEEPLNNNRVWWSHEVDSEKLRQNKTQKRELIGVISIIDLILRFVYTL